MHITSEPQEWTPIDPNLENELLNAYARIGELEGQLEVSERGLSCEQGMLYATTRTLNECIAELDQAYKTEKRYKEDLKLHMEDVLGYLNEFSPNIHYSMDYGSKRAALNVDAKQPTEKSQLVLKRIEGQMAYIAAKAIQDLNRSKGLSDD